MLTTDEFVNELITCQKEIVLPPARRHKAEWGHYRNSFTMRSINGQNHYQGFIRFNKTFIENFSVGLTYLGKSFKNGKKESICLLRLNGPHGPNIVHPFHESFHIHYASSNTINRGLKTDSNIEITDKYATLDQAIRHYVKLINLKKEDREKYFKTFMWSLFENDE